MSLIAELQRRNVIRVGAAYAVVGWVIAQVAEFAFENFGAPPWVLKSLVVALLLGLPIALIFAWAFERTPDGIRREKHVDRSESITPQTGRKLDRFIIGVLAVALAWFAWDKFDTSGDEMEAASALSDKSVAVLPFVAMSSGADDEYFADGLTEEILNSLAQLPELLVTARTSAFSFKGQDIPIQDIATALGVKHVVEGSVRRSGDRLRVTAQLIRADDAFHLWSENYDSTSTDTISVQENIAEQIAAALDVVLDESKREAMRNAGLRDVEAFTLYQKGLEFYRRAHGEMETIPGLREANRYFEQVIERVPTFPNVYSDHSDLFVHLLTTDSTIGVLAAGVTDADIAAAYPALIADYEAARRYSVTREMRLMTELDLAYLNGSWLGLSGRTEAALTNPGCTDGNWRPIIANVFGYAAAAHQLDLRILACDPRRSMSWFNAARSALWSGDTAAAIRLAREGSDIAPGSWLSTGLIRALVANGEYEKAAQELDNRVHDTFFAQFLGALIPAHQGDHAAAQQFITEMEASDGGLDDYWGLVLNAWNGNRDEANRAAAKIDAHYFSTVTLTQVTQWCACGAPWELSATPNFARKIKESNLPWPPATVMQFPLKDW